MKLMPRIVLTTEEAGFAEKLEQVLRSHNTSLMGTCSGLSELRTYLEDVRAPVAIVDIDSDPWKTLRELSHLAVLFPSTRFAVASTESSKELILEAMQVGARDFMRKELIESELDKVLERLLVDDTKTESDLGQIVTVFSAGGGCGATTVSLNLANELRLKSSQPVLAIDMDNCYGAVSSYLGIAGSYSIHDVLEQKERIDSQLITTSATRYKDNFDILVSPAASIADNRNGSSQYLHLAEALEACKEAYKYIIIDAPRMPGQTMRLLAKMSKAVLVVFQPSVKDIKIAKNILSALREFRVGSEKIFPLVNRFRQWVPLVPFEEVKKAVGTQRLYRIRNDFKKIVNCVNRGEPLSESAPHSGIRRDFQILATTIHACHNGNGRTQG
ncbi:MAG: AAA family ATPase [Planctomycetota bacterium]